MTSTIFWSLSGDLIILQIRLKPKKKVNYGIHVSFTLILMKLFLTHFVHIVL